MPSLFSFLKRLRRGPVEESVQRAPVAVAAEEHESAARSLSEPDPPTRAKPQARRAETRTAPRRPSPRRVSVPKPQRKGRTAPTQERPALSAPTAKVDLETLLRSRPSLDRVRSRRSEDPESRPNEGYRLLEALRDAVGGMLLLTATPMQLHEFELYSMVELVEPGLFNGYGDFAAARHEIAAINRAVTALRSERPSQAALEEARELLTQYAAPDGLALALNGRRAERLAAAEWLSRCHRLAHALVRNRKAEIGGFTSRIAHRIDVTPGEEELELQEDLVDYIHDRYAAASPNKRTAVGLVLVVFQKMLCSSSQALARSLESRRARLESELEEEALPASSDDPDLIEEEMRLLALTADDLVEEVATLADLARRAREIEDAKLVALEALVDRILRGDPKEKVLIFSQFLESIEMIRSRLALRHSVRVFHGGMSREEKDAAHEAFRHGVQVLVSSEAGGEGRNFQFCHVVVNYDLPWNPMKIEQRIGRVDRVGQTRDVEIYNFAVRGMLDERILDVLEHRIRIFSETVGALDPILESFEDEVGRIALGEKGDTDEAFARLDANLDEEIRKAKELEELRRDFVLDWRSLQRDRAAQILGRKPRATRDDLDRFCRAAVGRFPVGGIEAHDEGGLFIHVPGVLRDGRKDVEEDYRGSFDVKEALSDERMHFFAVGHPLVNSIFDNVGDPWWLPVGALESPEWTSDEPALLVDYQLDLYGIRDSGSLISHLVTSDGVKPPVGVSQPDEPMLEVRLPTLPPELLDRFQEMSEAAAQREAAARFEAYKADQAGLIEQEIERLMRMFDSRAGLLDDRIARNERQIDCLERFGTERQKTILPALRGQISADQARLAELYGERKVRLDALHATLPERHLRLLGVTIVVPRGKLREMAA
jgi:Helicase conserved C-terminal domain